MTKVAAVILIALVVVATAAPEFHGDGTDPTEQGAKSYPGEAIGMLKNWFVAQKNRLSAKYGDGNGRDPLTKPPIG
ncbi:hypothetical protein BSKO_00758 [Bryopsis sp. KO-2023]|nr:hypothetical protein BSKO_00758 [Bryopsis sp. KO-2023]